MDGDLEDSHGLASRRYSWRLCRSARPRCSSAYDAIRDQPRPSPTERHDRLRGNFAAVAPAGSLRKWQYEVTGGGRVWYLIDDARRTCWITYAGPAHPNATDR
jgi:hypothetical protein